jgi:replicative DNA helicase
MGPAALFEGPAMAAHLQAVPPALPDATEPPLRLVPHNIEAEQALLGAILVNNEAFDRVSDYLEPGHFYEGIHGEVFDVARTMIRSGKHVSPVTIKSYIPERDLGGLSVQRYLIALMTNATTTINAAAYGRLVYEMAMRRSLIVIGEEISQRAFDAPPDEAPRAQIENAERQLYALAESGRYEGGFQNFDKALKTALDMAAAAYRRDGGLSGVATGLRDLDAQMGGLQKSDLVIIAGRPAMGKTSLATNIAYNIARGFKPQRKEDGTIEAVNGGRVGFFSLEMSAEQLATRIIAEQSGISSSDIRRGKIEHDDFMRLQDAVADMQRAPLYIDQTGGISIAQLTARARRLKRQHGLDLIVIDYLQLLSGSGRRSDNRVQELTEITTGLKALAKELEVPVVALSQLSRQVENRDDKRPQLSDLRESGSIEQDADVVMFVYREEYYLKGKEPMPGTAEHIQWQDEMNKVHGKAEIIIGKQRHGPTGTVQMQFDASVTRFSDLADPGRYPEPM